MGGFGRWENDSNKRINHSFIHYSDQLFRMFEIIGSRVNAHCVSFIIP